MCVQFLSDNLAIHDIKAHKQANAGVCAERVVCFVFWSIDTAAVAAATAVIDGWPLSAPGRTVPAGVRSGRPAPAQNASSFSAFPMFVPSLSWQNDRF